MYVALVIRPCPGTVWSSYTHKTTCNKVDGVIRFSIYQIVLWQFLQVLNSLFQTCQQCGRSSAIHTFLTACLLICYTSCEIFACAVGSHFLHNVKPAHYAFLLFGPCAKYIMSYLCKMVLNAPELGSCELIYLRHLQARFDYVQFLARHG